MKQRLGSLKIECARGFVPAAYPLTLTHLHPHAPIQLSPLFFSFSQPPLQAQEADPVPMSNPSTPSSLPSTTLFPAPPMWSATGTDSARCFIPKAA